MLYDVLSMFSINMKRNWRHFLGEDGLMWQQSVKSSLIHSLTHSLTQILSRWLTHSQSLTHSLAHILSLTHSLTHPPYSPYSPFTSNLWESNCLFVVQNPLLYTWVGMGTRLLWKHPNVQQDITYSLPLIRVPVY